VNSISRRIKSRQAIKAFVLSLALFPIVLSLPPFGLFIWLLSFYFIYRYFESSSKRSTATKVKLLGRHLSSATADLAFSLSVTGSEFQGAESLARGRYYAISDFARNSLLRSLDGVDVRSSLASSFRRQRAVPTTYIVELLLSCNPDLLDIEAILEQTEDFTRRDFNEFTQRLNTLLPAYFFAAFFLPFSALILSTLMDSLAIDFLTAFFPAFSLIMWHISNMLFKTEATLL